MREPERESKFEGNSLSYGGGDLRRRIDKLGSRVRKKCISGKKNHSVIETSVESNTSEEGKSNAVSITPEFVEIMYLGTPEDQMKGVKYIRKLLSLPGPPISEVVQADLLPILVHLLKSQSDLMQYEAAWSLTNILSGSSLYVRYVIETGAVESFVKLLSSSNEDVQEQCAWALGNIAGDLDEFKKFALENGAMFALLNMMENTTSLKLLQTGAWAVCNLCVNNPDFKSISPAVPVLATFLSHENLDFIYNCISALVYLSDGKERIQVIINNGIVQSVVRLLSMDKECLVPLLLIIIINVSLGTEEHLDCLMKCDVLSAMKRQFDSRRESLRYRATCIVANMTLGKLRHIDYVIRNTFIISKICTFISIDSERVIRQAVNTFRNISNGGNEEHLLYLTESCFINRLCSALTITNTSIKMAALTCLENLLKIGDQNVEKGAYNQVALAIEECRGIEKVEELQSHDNQDIYHKAYDIMEKYFSTEELNFIGRLNF